MKLHSVLRHAHGSAFVMPLRSRHVTLAVTRENCRGCMYAIYGISRGSSTLVKKDKQAKQAPPWSCGPTQQNMPWGRVSSALQAGPDLGTPQQLSCFSSFHPCTVAVRMHVVRPGPSAQDDQRPSSCRAESAQRPSRCDSLL